ncbi:DUF4405 domain-containing protein [Candidatus Pacearchaeota archaeon]|nr:DUF4405 domain-containing protein [Candidatus Pacearchaeota archaeon]
MRRKMDKSHIKYIVDVLMGISFLLVGITGIFKMPGLRNKFLWVFELIPGRQMAMIHDWSGIVIILLVGIHLALNWDWIKSMTKVIFRGNQNGK